VPASTSVPPALVTAKLSPARPFRTTIARPRLVTPLRGRPVVLVVADAGYGKSTLLYEWAHTRQHVAWYTLDERDRDPTAFGQHLLAASGAGLTGWRAIGDGAADDLAARVLNHVQRAAAPVALVLDDYHAVAGSSTIDRAVARLLEDRPPNLCIGIGSRRPLTLPLARLRASGAVTDVDGPALCFTRDEVAAVLAAEGLAGIDLDELYDLTGGWPAVLQLLRDAWTPRRGLHGPRAGRTGGRGASLHAFLEEEIVGGLADEHVELLARLSVLDEVDAEACASIADDPGAFERLERLADRFSFIALVIDEQGKRTYRIHRLVRDHLEQSLPPQIRRAVLQRASDGFEAAGRAVEAAQALIALGDYERLGALIRREAMALMAQGRSHTLSTWFSHLPAHMLEREPALLARRAHLQAELGEFATALRQFEQAIDGLLRLGDTRTAADALRALAGLHEHRGEYSAARLALERALTLVSADDPALGLRLQNHLAMTRLADGDCDGAETLAREVVGQAAAHGELMLEAAAQHNYAHVLMLRGRLTDAVHAYRVAVDLKRQREMGASLAYTFNDLGFTYACLGQLAEAQATLEEAERTAEQQDVPLIRAYALSNLGDLYRDQGDIARAQSLYTRSLELKQVLGNPFAMAHTWNGLATLWRRAGDVDQARLYNRRALELRSQEAGLVERQLLREEAGCIAMAAGDLRAAHAELEAAAAELERAGALYFWKRAAWRAAVARWRLDDGIGDLFGDVFASFEEPDDRALLDALVAEAPEFAVAAWAAGCQSAVLLDALVRHDVAVLRVIDDVLGQSSPAAARNLVELLPRLKGNAPLQVLVDASRRGTSATRTAAEAVLCTLRSAPAAPLVVRGFGGLRVERRGAPIPDTAWRRQRGRDLLALLLLAGPTGRPRDELIAHCWPTASLEAGAEQFHSHLYALRAALEPESPRGSSRYVLADGGLYRLAFDLIERWDVRDFDEALVQARAADARGDRAAAERAYARAASGYSGPLFSGLAPQDDWLERTQERYQQLALEARAALARFREETGDLLGARDAWTGVLALDGCREDAHRGLMRVLNGLGQREAALAQFRECVSLLERELDLEPSAETLGVYRQIVTP